MSKRIILIGDPFCGKSFLIWKFIQREPICVGTIGTEKYCRDIVVNGARFSLNITDSGYPAFDERYAKDIFLSEEFRSADAILLCFDISRAYTLHENLSYLWLPLIEEHCKDKKIPYVLVGLKKDMRSNPDIIRYGVPVTEEEGKLVAEKIKVLGYVECSSTCNEGVEEVFETVVRLLLKEKPSKLNSIKGFMNKMFRK